MGQSTLMGTNRDNESDIDVTIVGAGPAGLMLASNLARYGIRSKIIDDRDDKTSTGRADGLQPKTIETLRQLRLADSLLCKGVRIYDICFWQSTSKRPLHRTGRQRHYPDELLDVKDPFILLVHQGMVEQVFIEDLRSNGIEVSRGLSFVTCADDQSNGMVAVQCEDTKQSKPIFFTTKYLIGCDGAHSRVRKSLPGAQMIGESSNSRWGVLDGVLDTNFPDLWSKAVIQSETAGALLIIPRERNMTRLYIELEHSNNDGRSIEVDQEIVMAKARRIMAPFTLSWRRIEWFSVYRVGQRIASTFSNTKETVFIAGDASHTHSPKAAQGMNTSMHDAFNLSWKLNLTLRGLAHPTLLSTYENERRKIAQDLINFDFEHAAAFLDGDSEALTQNFATNVGFISGVGVEYNANVLNIPGNVITGALRAGEILPPAKVTRYIDANPVDIQLDIPMLGQFRVFFVIPNIATSGPFLTEVCEHIASDVSIMGQSSCAAERSYASLNIDNAEADNFVQAWRYTSQSKLYTFAVLTTMDKSAFEVSDLPHFLQKSKWTVYLDDIMQERSGRTCTNKWLGSVPDESVTVVIVRPDGYVGTLQLFDSLTEHGDACGWLDEYFSNIFIT